MNTWILKIGQILLGLYFLLPGLGKFAAWDLHIEMMTAHQIPWPTILLPMAAVLQIIGASLIITNRFVGPAALGLALMTLLINLGMHDFWNYDGIEGQHETQNFVKNLGIFAGLLVLSAHHQGLHSLRKLFS